MTDREKVIKGFEVCLENIDQQDCPNDCPYLSDCSKYENRVIFQPLMRDALTLLKEQEAKEQEPRVMASSEIQPDDLVWIEVPQSDEIWPALLRKTDWFDHPTWAMRGYALGGYYLHDGYGRDWRCWTAKPTEDQRLAVKW